MASELQVVVVVFLSFFPLFRPVSILEVQESLLSSCWGQQKASGRLRATDRRRRRREEEEEKPFPQRLNLLSLQSKDSTFSLFFFIRYTIPACFIFFSFSFISSSSSLDALFLVRRLFFIQGRLIISTLLPRFQTVPNTLLPYYNKERLQQVFVSILERAR